VRIVKLIAENFKKLKAIEITPEGNVVIISGKNAAGKTCILDIMLVALGGAKGIPKEPIRKGQDRAVTIVDLGEYKATRVFTKKGNYLTVETKEGMIPKEPPGALLDKMIGDLTFDPLEFVSAKNRDEILLNLVGLKDAFERIKLESDEIYAHRTFINGKVKQAEGQLKGYGFEGGYVGPSEIKPMQNLIDKMKVAREKSGEIFQLDTKRDGTARECEKSNERILYLQKELDKAIEEHNSLEAIHANQIQELSTMKAPDIAAIESEMNKRTMDNEKAKKWKEYRDLKLTYEKLEKESNALTTKLENKRAQKGKAILNAKFPIEGLTYNDGIHYNGIPFEQISASEKLRVSMAVAMKLNPEIRVIRITDGSLLDSENMKVIEELAKEQDYQIWIEKVDETGKVGIYIEEGEIKADNQ